MHVGHRTERRLARQPRVERHGEIAGHRLLEHRGHLHQQIVRVLSIVQRLALIRFATLQKQGITARANGSRFQAHHAMQVQLA